jgi:hypothetical protein
VKHFDEVQKAGSEAELDYIIQQGDKLAEKLKVEKNT